MMLGVVVTKILQARAPIYDKVILYNSIVHPIESHVNNPGSLLLDSFIQDSIHGGIICHHQCGQMGMAHLLQGHAELFPLLCIDE
eukprot:6230703-Ditylum_brightwellii.AAC.1